MGVEAATVTLVPKLLSVPVDLGLATVTWATTFWVQRLPELIVTVTTLLG